MGVAEGSAATAERKEGKTEAAAEAVGAAAELVATTEDVRAVQAAEAALVTSAVNAKAEATAEASAEARTVVAVVEAEAGTLETVDAEADSATLEKGGEAAVDKAGSEGAAAVAAAEAGTGSMDDSERAVAEAGPTAAAEAGAEAGVGAAAVAMDPVEAEALQLVLGGCRTCDCEKIWKNCECAPPVAWVSTRLPSPPLRTRACGRACGTAGPTFSRSAAAVGARGCSWGLALP